MSSASERLAGAPLTGERIDNDATFGPQQDPADDAGWQEAVARLRAAGAALRAALDAREHADLGHPLPEERTPLGQLFTGLNAHDAYHAGQIVLLRRLQGNWRTDA